MSVRQNITTLEQIQECLIAKLEGKNFELIFNKYKQAFNDDYLSQYSADEIVTDIILMDKLSIDNQYAISLKKGKDNRQHIWQIKLFRFNNPVSLSRGLPLIENFGVKLLDEHPHKVDIDAHQQYFICDFGVLVPDDWEYKLDDINTQENFKNAIIDAFNRIIENDILNQLVVASNLTAREVVLLRAITHYLAQTSLPFSKQYLKECLARYALLARDLFEMFIAKFSVNNHNEEKIQAVKSVILQELSTVNNIDDDRILKAYLATIDAMLRTNFYQLDEHLQNKSYISFKLQSNLLNFLAKPKPLYEIFVYSTRCEGVHLRGGKVARGGIRWSDRKEDFRTEVLGLVKAQVVKNSVIVPTGSKGGFVCKKLPPITQRQEYLSEGVECYKLFISGLLDITDNIVSGKIIPPKNVVRYDNDDPYLVVAADKGTATFSDYANALSVQYNFWLGDAFASGGSAGYDHKKMGITARGAWESAKRHFRHLGINIQKEDFTVIGIGDMAGDVFGNGMLLSEHIKLVAAFNHQHIFIDPTPNAKTSFEERARLFALPQSNWRDYDIEKISKGGGIFDRVAKSIPLTVEIQNLIGTLKMEMSPDELIQNLLKLQVDMLYNGGIGTYIKSIKESHEQVKDKANDHLRVNANELKVKVVIEGGNLGVTQLGRVEFAKLGGAIYTDAIDNSAGVDCSDHEVNIKILFADIMQNEKLTIDERNRILSSMTDDVAQLVLRDNYLQTQILRYADKRSKELFLACVNFIDKLEKEGELDRDVEFLPNDHEIAERKHNDIGMTMPELAVMLAYSKIRLNREILASNLLKNKLFEELLINYFPKYLQNNYLEYIKRHYLRDEIIATELSNFIVNRMGITFISRFQDEFRVDTSQIIQAFFMAYKLIDADNLMINIESLDNKINADMQVTMFIRIKKALERLTRWILRNIKNVSDLINDYSIDIKNLLDMLPDLLKSNEYAEVLDLEKQMLEANVPPKLAQIVARSSAIPQVIDIVILKNNSQLELYTVAYNYFYIGKALRLDWLRKSLIALPEHNKWQALSRSALLADGYKLYSSFINQAVKYAISKNDLEFAARWIQQEKLKINQINEMFDELQSYRILDLAMLSAAVRELSLIF